MAQTPHIGIIGLDDTGAEIVTRLQAAQYAVSVFDTNPKRLQPFPDTAVLTRRSPKSLAAAADVILINMDDTAAVSRMFEQDLLGSLSPGNIVADLGLMDLFETRRLAQLAELRKVQYLDAPMNGGPKDARKGTMGLFVGGAKAAFDACLPVFRTFATDDNIRWCGPAGSGQIVKASERLIVGLGRAVVLEAVAFSRSFGIDPATLLEALERSEAVNYNLQNVMQRFLRKGGESVSVHYHFLPHILSAARQHNQSAPLTEALTEFLRNAPPSVIERGQHVPAFWTELLRQPPEPLQRSAMVDKEKNGE